MLSKPIKTVIQIALSGVVLMGAIACTPESGEQEESVREREGTVAPRVGEREGVIGREGSVDQEEAEEREEEGEGKNDRD